MAHELPVWARHLPRRGLVGYWPLDEGSGSTANDLSGNQNNGTWSGTQASPNSSYYGAGKVYPYAGWFDGSTDRVGLPYYDVGGTLTYSFWVNSAINGGGGRFFDLMSTLVEIGGNTLTFFPNVISGSSYSASYNFGAGTWYYIVIIQTGQRAARPYRAWGKRPQPEGCISASSLQFHATQNTFQ